MAENLWPDFPKGQRRTIKTILMEVGSGIADKTEGTIRFYVDTSLEGQGIIKHRCQLQVVPITYFYPLFTVTHTVNMFPVITVAEALDRPVSSSTEDEFVEVLRQIITSESTRNVVDQLLDAAV